MNRRNFITGSAVAAATLPVQARIQDPFEQLSSEEMNVILVALLMMLPKDRREDYIELIRDEAHANR